MSQRVLATDQAHQAITSIRAILDGNFEDTITRLRSEGTTLSDPNVWDGTLAVSFRNEIWPATTAALDAAHVKLNELHAQLTTIQQNIMQAGGNA